MLAFVVFHSPLMPQSSHVHTMAPVAPSSARQPAACVSTGLASTKHGQAALPRTDGTRAGETRARRIARSSALARGPQRSPVRHRRPRGHWRGNAAQHAQSHDSTRRQPPHKEAVPSKLNGRAVGVQRVMGLRFAFFPRRWTLTTAAVRQILMDPCPVGAARARRCAELLA